METSRDRSPKKKKAEYYVCEKSMRVCTSLDDKVLKRKLSHYRGTDPRNTKRKTGHKYETILVSRIHNLPPKASLYVQDCGSKRRTYSCSVKRIRLCGSSILPD
mmetsp:Transcript_11433/g.18386  ORF Transcript_11433/g.18386 Transcript_11433/m.18386 type:complete len:104 (-) Transcript_11433:216-527(-)